ncbi:MAG: DNA-binding response regulator, partial [Syntrophales bacterium LBB04]|nr:DNA-binding response regulator [Syntrophales bacterium LBB04]
MTRVLIADDHRLVREGLKKILTETKDIVVVA